MLADRAEQVEPLAKIINSQKLTSNDVKFIRETVLRGWVLSDGDANLLIQFQQICSSIDQSWDKFYLLALTNYFIEALQPVGALDESTSDFILEKLSVDGCLLTELDVTLLGDLLERAVYYPETLPLLGLNTVKMGLVQRKGVLRPPKNSGAALCEAEVAAVRRFINPKSRQADLKISDPAARLVFDINEISEEEQNHKRWSELFLDIMLQYCLREAPLELETVAPSALRNQAAPKGGNERTKSWISALSSGWDANEKSAAASTDVADVSVVATAAPATQTHPTGGGDHTQWLADILAAKTTYSENELQLLSYLTEQSAHVPPSLLPLLRTPETVNA